jgi:hypothetical protein
MNKSEEKGERRTGKYASGFPYRSLCLHRAGLKLLSRETEVRSLLSPDKVNLFFKSFDDW